MEGLNVQDQIRALQSEIANLKLKMVGHHQLIQNKVDQLQNEIDEMKPIVVRLYRRMIVNDARQDLREEQIYQPVSGQLGLALMPDPTDRDAKDLSVLALKMILERKDEVRSRGNDEAHPGTPAPRHRRQRLSYPMLIICLTRSGVAWASSTNMHTAVPRPFLEDQCLDFVWHGGYTIDINLTF